MKDNNQASEDIRGAIRTAISKDFETIYVKEFTTNWKIERLSRNLEIGVMDFDAIQSLIRTEKLKLLDKFENDCKYNYTTFGNSEKMLQVSGVLKRIEAERNKLKEQTNDQL